MVVMATCSNAKYVPDSDESESESQELREDLLAKLFERAFRKRDDSSSPSPIDYGSLYIGSSSPIHSLFVCV